jgi:APA family basic amino acid/polyamine antiporter
MFVAYTGYGRIATLGEEIVDPERSIPRAILVTLAVTVVLYVAVVLVGITAVGVDVFGQSASHGIPPLAAAAAQLRISGLSSLISLGALAAMLGVLLNLVLGLSRVVLAMGRRGDLPAIFARVDDTGSTPYPAVILTGTSITLLALLLPIKSSWSFSAFTVLMYYSITNAAALKLHDTERLYPRYISWLGLLACLSLAFWVDTHIWIIGLVLLLAGLLWHRCRATARNTNSNYMDV